MRTKIITTTLILSLTVVLMTTSTGTANAETIIYVPDHYSTIQAAVDAANPGDTIIVRDDIYAENIKVNKDHLTIKSENGVEKTIVQAANPNDHVFEVTANYVKISGFTVKGASASSRAGIHLRAIEFCDISGNIISNNQDIGIYLWNSNHIILSSNIISNNGEGIFLDRSSENIITNNTIVANIFRGITPQNSSNDNNIINNNILSNERAIEIYFSSGNLVIRNNIKYNKGGILLVSGLRTVIYLNSFIDNIPYQTEIIDSINNLWNYSEKITYVYNGKTYTNYLGNYWSDYSGSDADGDGIGDTPYSINSDKDNYPLMQPFENYVIGEAPPVPVSEFWVKVTLPTNINCLEVRENPKDPNSIKKFPCISNGGLLKLTKDSLTGWWAIKIKDDSKDMWWHIEDISGKISGWAPGISLLPLEDAFNSSFRLDFLKKKC